MKLSCLAFISTLAAIGFPELTQAACGPQRPKPVCRELMLPIAAAANNTDLPPFPNSTAPGVLYNKYLGTFNASALPHIAVSGTFNISALYCLPTVNVTGREGTIQFLIHGLTATKEYWNGEDYPSSDFEGEYSWIDHAASQGYATIAIDSLGNGHSDRPDPIRVVQGPMQLSVMFGIMRGLRAGSLPGVAKYSKVIMATHSYGSVLGRVFSQVFPTNGADAYILTAAASTLTGLQQFLFNLGAQAATVADPRFVGLAPGYLSATKNIRESIYGLNGTFDPNMAEWDSHYPHVFAAGEISASTLPQASNFTGPVMVITGRQDQIACGNGTILGPVPDCGVGPNSYVNGLKTLFPKACVFTAYVPEDTAHNVNTHYSAPESFGAAHLWLQSVGF